MDRGDLWAIVQRVAKSWAQLKRLKHTCACAHLKKYTHKYYKNNSYIFTSICITQVFADKSKYLLIFKKHKDCLWTTV